MSNGLDGLLQKVNLREILAEETKERIESAVDSFIPSTNNGDFHERKEEEAAAAPKPVKEFNATNAATNIVTGITTIEALILTPIGVAKNMKRFGGKQGIKKMRDSLTKQYQGKELTEEDQRKIKAFEEYERKMKLLSSEVIPTPEEIQRRIQSAIPYCEATQIDFSPGLAFWGSEVGGLVGKITKILLT